MTKYHISVDGIVLPYAFEFMTMAILFAIEHNLRNWRIELVQSE